MHQRLPVPQSVQFAESSRELLRAFAADDDVHVALAWDFWKDEGTWGIFLVDVARHVANAMQQQTGAPPQQTMRAIRAAFDAEWAHGVDSTTGSVADR